MVFFGFWKNPDSVLKLYADIIGDGHELMLVIDWKLNDGAWNITSCSNEPDYDADKHDYFSENIGTLLTDSCYYVYQNIRKLQGLD